MKKRIWKITKRAAMIFGAVVVLLFASIVYPPLGNYVFSFAFGCWYPRVGKTECTLGARTETLAIYKAYGKPFLLVGPCRFSDDDPEYVDFFFVNKNQVVRTAIDKGGDSWFRMYDMLFILDDMTVWDRVRLPYWDDLENDPGSSVTLDAARGVYVYEFRIRNRTVPVSFAIPARFYTSDMLDHPFDASL